MCEKDCEQEGGRENERRGDVCEAEIAREGKGACLSVCVCMCVRTRYRLQGSKLERQSKQVRLRGRGKCVCVCVRAARDRQCFACVSAANEK